MRDARSDYATGIHDGRYTRDDYDRVVGHLEREQKRCQAELDVAMRRAKRRPHQSQAPVFDEDGLYRTLQHVLTLEVPDDPDHRIARAAIVRALISYAELRDTPEGHELILHGPLIPEAGGEPVGPLGGEAGRLLRIMQRSGAGGVAKASGGASGAGGGGAGAGGAGAGVGGSGAGGSGAAGQQVQCVKQVHACLTHSTQQRLTDADANLLVTLAKLDEPVPAEFAYARVPPPPERWMSQLDDLAYGRPSWSSEPIVISRRSTVRHSIEHVRTQLRRAASELGPAHGLAGSGYEELCMRWPELPTRSNVNSVAERNGMTGATLRREVMLEVHGVPEPASDLPTAVRAPTLSLNKTAQLCGVSKTAIRYWVDAGRIPTVRKQGRVRERVPTAAAQMLAAQCEALRAEGGRHVLGRALDCLDVEHPGWTDHTKSGPCTSL